MNKKLHILFLSSWFPSRVNPANGDFVLRHAEAAATKHNVTVIHVVTDENLQSNFEISRSTQNNVTTVIRYVPKFNKSISKFFQFFNAYKECIQEIGHYDIVHHNITFPIGLMALYLKWFKKKPFIISEHWTGYLNPQNKSITFLEKFITKIIIINAKFICPVSNDLKNQMVNFGLKGCYFKIPNVVNTNIFFPIKKTSKPYTITHISALQNKQKNIDGILSVIKKLSLLRDDFIFKIIGNGDKEETQSILKKLEIPKTNIEFLNSKSQEQIAEILQCTNLYLSFSNYETFGIVMAEAIATGTPVITTNTGILTEIDATNFSTTIPVKDQNALLNAILFYMDSKKEFKTKEMFNLIETLFSLDKVGTSFSDLYYDALGIK